MIKRTIESIMKFPKADTIQRVGTKKNSINGGKIILYNLTSFFIISPLCTFIILF